MKKLVAAFLVLSCMITPAFADAHEPTPTPPIQEDRICDNGERIGVCDVLFGYLLLFAVIDWMVPLNRSDASPQRCRGNGSVINAPSPWGTSNCKPLPDQE